MAEKKTSVPCWLKKTARSLALPLQRSDRAEDAPRIILLGVGNELHGDDAAGMEVVRRLRLCLASQPNILLVEGGAAPENFSGQLRRFQPDWLIVLDIGELGAAPGTIDWLEMEQIRGVTAVTHGLPVSMLARYLSEETGCRVGAVLIQPASLEFETLLSPAVSAGVEEVVAGLASLL